MARPENSIVRSETVNGKRIQGYGKNEKEAFKDLERKKRKYEENKDIINNSVTVRVWAEKAVETYKTNQSEITKKKYWQRMKHCILEELGSMRLKDVKPLHCQNCINLQVGKSKRHIDEISQQLNFIFKTALINNLISVNPAENISKPKGTKGTRRAITDIERIHLLNVCCDDKFLIFEIMLKCGTRPSEAMELKGFDVTLLDNQPVLHIRGTKTRNADRFVPLNDNLYERLKKVPKNEYICHTENNTKYNATSYGRLTKRLYREMNISMGCKIKRNALIPPYPLAPDFVPYCLRHTYCTDLCKAGVDIRTAQYLMGHSDISTTANIYTHTDTSMIKEAAEKVNGYTIGTPSVHPKIHQNA